MKMNPFSHSLLGRRTGAMLMMSGLLCAASTAYAQIPISTWTDLANINTNLGGSYILVNDLNSSTAGYTTNFTRIGSVATPFTGTFNGDGYTISDLQMNSGVADTGLFGATSGATIQDVTLTNATVTGASNVGTLIGQATNTTVTNVGVSGLSVSGSAPVGGLIGTQSGGSVTFAYVVNMTTSGSGNSGTGGLIGAASGSVTNVFVGTVIVGTAGGPGFVGGIIGVLATGGTLTNSAAIGTSVGGNNNVGGLVGSNSGTVSSSYAVIAVNGSNTNNRGGAIGGTGTSTCSDVFFDLAASSPNASAGSCGTPLGTTAMQGTATGMTTLNYTSGFFTVIANTEIGNTELFSQTSGYPVVQGIPIDVQLAAQGLTPLFVDLESFTASAAGPGSPVALTWVTSSEIDNVGFNVYRLLDGELVQLTPSLIPAEGSEFEGATYTFTDNSVDPSWTVLPAYFLEDIDLMGVSTFHGPASYGATGGLDTTNVQNWTLFN